MKKNMLYLLLLVNVSCVWGQSNYFFQRVKLDFSGNETYAFSLKNTGNQVAYIAALGAETHSSVSGAYFNMKAYKGSILMNTNYTSIPDSTLEISKEGDFSIVSNQVYELQATGQVGALSGFHSIPALYSLSIEPQETLTVTLNSVGSAIYTLIILWQEVIS